MSPSPIKPTLSLASLTVANPPCRPGSQVPLTRPQSRYLSLRISLSGVTTTMWSGPASGWTSQSIAVNPPVQPGPSLDAARRGMSKSLIGVAMP